jgi:hypothetical protein
MKTRAVEDRYLYWMDPPPERSDRCAEWVERIEAGWRRNRRIGMMGYDESAQFFGVYMWEWLNVLYPLLASKDG